MKFIQKNILAVLLLAVLIVGGGFVYFEQKGSEKSQTDVAQTQEVSSKVSVTVKADGSEKTYTVEDAVGKTALEVTEAATTIEKKGEGQNAFVTSINGRVAEESKKEFWKLFINGEESQVGAGSYTLESGDTITWEIATFE